MTKTDVIPGLDLSENWCGHNGQVTKQRTDNRGIRRIYAGMSEPERFLARFVRQIEWTDEGCWLIRGPRLKGGYRQFKVGRRNFLAHRVSHWLFKGGLPNLTIDHLCRTPRCVNPDHLEDVTMRENIVRGLRARGYATH